MLYRLCSVCPEAVRSPRKQSSAPPHVVFTYDLSTAALRSTYLGPRVALVLTAHTVGVAVQLAASYRYLTEGSGAPGTGMVNGSNVIWGGLMYGSYFALFTKFAVERYCKKPAKKVV